MDKPFLGSVVVGLAVLVSIGAFVVAPRMQSAQDKVLARTSLHAERARRLLHQFSQNQARIEGLLEALAETGVGTQIDVDRVLEEAASRAAVEEEDARLQEWARQGAGLRRELDERFLRAAYGSNWQEHQQAPQLRLGANVSQMSRSLQHGLAQRDRLMAENDNLLRQAREAVNEALGESIGGVSGGDDINTNRLKGIVLYYLAQNQAYRAAVLRREAAQDRSQLAQLGRRARGWLAEKNMLVSSDIDAHVADAESKLAEAQARLTTLKASADGVESEVQELESRIERTRAAADQAREEMDGMERRGSDLMDAQGFAKFESRFNEAARTYREAISQMHRLQYGTLRNARIDRSGDYLHGHYEPVDDDRPMEPDRGLAGLEAKLGQIRLELASAEETVETARGLRDALIARKAEYQRRGDTALARLEALAQSAAEVYAKFQRASEKAGEAEDAAIQQYRQSAGAFQAAARLAATRVGEANSAVAGLSPDSRERSWENAIAGDDWLEQQYRVDAADAQIEHGRLHYTISEEARRTAEVLEALPQDIEPAQADPAAWRARQEEARTQGIEVLREAYDLLQRTRGKLRSHWTVAAEAAAAANLLALLGEQGLRDVAISTYQQVVSGNEQQPQMQPYVDRLNLLQAQQASDQP